MLHLLGVLAGIIVCAWVLPYVIPFVATLVIVLGVVMAATYVMAAIHQLVLFDWSNEYAVLAATCASFLILYIVWKWFAWKLSRKPNF